MKPLALVLCVMMASGCATTAPAALPTLIAASQIVEAKPLPPDPSVEPLPPGTPSGDSVEPIEAGTCLDKSGKPVAGATSPCPGKAGIEVSEARAARDALYRIRYPEMRRMYEADRQVWAAQRDLYEERVRTAQTELQKAQPSWWQQHGPALGMVAGFVVGAVMTVAIVYGVNQATK